MGNHHYCGPQYHTPKNRCCFAVLYCYHNIVVESIILCNTFCNFSLPYIKNIHHNLNWYMENSCVWLLSTATVCIISVLEYGGGPGPCCPCGPTSYANTNCLAFTATKINVTLVIYHLHIYKVLYRGVVHQEE